MCPTIQLSTRREVGFKSWHVVPLSFYSYNNLYTQYQELKKNGDGQYLEDILDVWNAWNSDRFTIMLRFDNYLKMDCIYPFNNDNIVLFYSSKLFKKNINNIVLAFYWNKKLIMIMIDNVNILLSCPLILCNTCCWWCYSIMQLCC